MSEKNINIVSYIGFTKTRVDNEYLIWLFYKM